MKKKIIIGVSSVLVVISIVVYVIIKMAPYRSPEVLKDYLSKENANFEVNLEFSSDYNGGTAFGLDYVATSYMANKVYNYKVTKDSALVEWYADYEIDDVMCYQEVYYTQYYEAKSAACFAYYCCVNEGSGYDPNSLWYKGTKYVGTAENYSDYVNSFSQYAYYNLISDYTTYIHSVLNYDFMEIDGIYYQSYNGIKVAHYANTLELKANKAIITINKESGVDRVITISKIGSTSVKSPLPEATKDGFIFDYVEYCDSYLLLDYNGNSKNVVIPETYNDGINGEKNVFKIGTAAFYGCSDLESIDIPDTITQIGGYAFTYCSSLESIDIPDTVTNIESYVFSVTNIESITIPKSISYLYVDTFSGCDNLKTIYVYEDISSSILDKLPSDVSIIYIQS